MEHITELIQDMESEMVSMWSLGEAATILKLDPEYITVIIRAVFYERKHFESLGMIIGEA